MSCRSCNIQNCTPSDSLPRNCSDPCKALSTNPLPCHDTRDSRKSKAYFAAWRTRTTFSLSDLRLLSLIICVAVDFFLIQQSPQSVWNKNTDACTVSEITSVSTECRTRLDILIEVVLLLARLTHNVLKVFKPEIDSFNKTFLTASKHNCFFKLVVKRRGIQEFVTCTCMLIAAWKIFQLQIRFSTAPGNNLKRLQYDLIIKISFQANGGESSSRKSKTAALL
jgi:hypothetical protein